jgi:hypothetical protein
LFIKLFIYFFIIGIVCPYLVSAKDPAFVISGIILVLLTAATVPSGTSSGGGGGATAIVNTAAGGQQTVSLPTTPGYKWVEGEKGKWVKDNEDSDGYRFMRWILAIQDGGHQSGPGTARRERDRHQARGLPCAQPSASDYWRSGERAFRRHAPAPRNGYDSIVFLEKLHHFIVNEHC